MFIWLEEYLKHSALNLGQALQGIRFLLTHPDVDRVSAPGTFRHALHAIPLRLKRIANDLVFAVLPPRWHHTRDELASLHVLPVRRWFQCGYCPYRFAETGEMLSETDTVREPRWDPRCKDEPAE